MTLPVDVKVLVVDEFESMRRIIKQVLNGLGFKDITLVDDAAIALPLLRTGDFGLLITDWSMPIMEGIDLVRAVRADGRLKSMPILMVTTESKREQIIMAAQAGVNDYIVKPFTSENLAAKVERIFSRISAK